MQDPSRRRSINDLREVAQQRPLATLTAYDYPTGRLADECGLDFILVGDSLGMVALGFEDTTWVTMDHMLHHTGAVSRGVSQTPIVADLPFESYQSAPEALSNARRLVNAGANAVKLEGGLVVLPQIEAILETGIAVVGHLGMLPQQVRIEGGYKKKGKTPAQADALLADALALEEAGVSIIILESVMPEVARKITDTLKIPTIGIGCGDDTCSGEVAVISDVVGSYPWFVPPFAKPEADVAQSITQGIQAYVRRVTRS